MENTKKTIVQIIDENTFVKDGLITVENAIKCAELYASQFKHEIERLNKENDVLINEAHDQCLVNMDLETRAVEAIIKAFEDGTKHGLTTTTGPVMTGKEYFDNSAFDFKQSEPVSADVENDFDELGLKFIESLSPEMGLHKTDEVATAPYWYSSEGNSINLIAYFGMAMEWYRDSVQSQQPVSIQWLSEEEIDKLIEAIWNKSHLTTRKLDFIDCKKLSGFIQSQLQSRVNAVDEKQVLISFCGWLFGGLCDETEQIIVTDYLTSKSK